MQTIRKGRRKHSRDETARTRMREQFTMSELFEKFMWSKRAEGLAPRTIEEYELHFSWFFDWLDGDLTSDEMRTEVFLEYIHFMKEEKGLAPNTVNIRIRTMRAFLRWCYKENHIVEPIHEKIKLMKTEQDTIESFTTTEVKAIFNAFDTSTFVGFRDKVMVTVLLDTMVRIGELLNMKRSLVDLKKGIIQLEAMNTKTRKAREVPISSKTAKLLKEYMIESEDFGEEILFVTYDGRPIEGNTWRTRLKEIGELAGIKGKRVSPHTFRHTGALFYIMNGGDPFSLQKILGHTDMSMTRRYIQMTNIDVRKQHNVFSPLRNI
ncbi:tyrosine-type recombinase/integrase [Neobacillus sp. YX16]|uniref:tyrosine-type recombinase/integrase n=1 Tax=Neobacillus sp. YX16 TaxID=3047874 RepID=UPI0024C269BE|nr:tyrosine-type recombinase/integrase [Neobacillus sp. YX16]WHZ05843.1 tyrosine-type recombinase/integrase [Neobacillus sp. YX16]